MPILIPINVETIDKVTLTEGDEEVSNCTVPYGHCFGSDGGSGIPKDLKVAEGRGGDQEVWTLNAAKTQILIKATYSRCQYCLKVKYVQDI